MIIKLLKALFLWIEFIDVIENSNNERMIDFCIRSTNKVKLIFD